MNLAEENLPLPGQYFDAETGLHYNLFRDYDPKTGRYVEPDPMGVNGGMNLYGYAEGNPINEVDPLGLISRKGACDQAASNIRGILKHGGHHAEGDKSMKPLCSQLRGYMDKFEKYKCMVYYPDLMAAANDFWSKYCNTPPPPSAPACDQGKCEKVKKLVPVVVAGYVTYKLVELWLCPPLVWVTP